MKKLTFLIFLLTIVLSIVITSCKKDAASISKKELLTSNQWKFLSSKTNGVADVIDNCEKDDFTIFSSNGTYAWNPTTVKCDPSETIQNGTWTLSSDEKTLTLDDVDVATILELTGSKLVISTIDGSDIWEQTFVAF